VGTTFELYLPLSRDEVAQQKSIKSVEDFRGNNESILIVDDVKTQREIATNMLSKLNYAVNSVSNGEEAIHYIKNKSPNLIVLDMIMDPGIDGFDTFKRIKKIRPEQKAIIVSGFAETDRVKKPQSLGAGKYIKKPYTIEKIGLAIKQELNRQNLAA
jgi:DNA-binding NtrC family response regulator